jgi:thymidylate kinase
MTNPVAFPPFVETVPTKSLAHLLGTFFSTLESMQIRYCILHGYDRMPESIPGDLDLAIHEDDIERLGTALQRLIADGYYLLQHRHYAVNSHRFDFGWTENGEFCLAGLDIISEFRYAGAILFPASRFVLRRWQNEGIWFASHEDQLAYLLAKRTLKGGIDASQTAVLQHLISEIGPRSSAAIANSLFGPTAGPAIIDAIKHEQLSLLLPTMARALKKRFSLRHLRNFFSYWGPEWRRRWQRWRQPTGMLLVVLGSDGCGKNTLIEHIGGALREAFRGQHHYHWRPGALIPLKTTDGPELFPHGRLRRSPLLSTLYASGFQLDYWFGYLFRIYPALTRSGLVFFNRYHHDMQVDSLRYRYGGPKWLIKLYSLLLPGDPLILVLDGDPERIYARKPELSLFELSRQRREYRKLADRLKNAFVIDANVEAEEVARQALVVIAAHLSARNIKQYPEWFALGH